MKNGLITFFLLINFFTKGLYAGDGDTMSMNFFTKYDLQQWKGSWWHKKFDYIDPNINYKKAYLKLELGCASYGCCVWDYTFQIYISKALNGFDTLNFHKLDTAVWNGKNYILDSLWVNRKSTNYEIGRLITPYGTYMRAGSNGYNNNWTHPYYYDITDYLPLLKDSFGISVLSGGYDGKKGFNISADLIMIEGSSNLMPYQVYSAYQKSYSYKDETQIDTIIPKFKFKLSNNEKYAKFRSRITGHGQQGEFSPVEYYITLNGNEIFSKRLWKEDCDKTYIQPQGGTWIFSRCNWCPGEKIIDFELDISKNIILNDSNELRVLFRNLETSSSTIQANYVVTGQVISYTSKDSFDLVVDEIIAPNSDKNYLINNPLCQGPKIKLKNIGIVTAKEAYIDYWVSENEKTTYLWKGTLGTNESVEVNLPVFPWNNLDISVPKFYVSLQKHPNNMIIWNDLVSSEFVIPDVVNTDKIVFEIKNTDETINTNDLTLTDELGNIVFSKTYPTDKKTYRDTVSLSEGCYRMELTDYESRFECGDGLSFFVSSNPAPNGLGKSTGTFTIRNGTNNAIIKSFNPDFGGKINYQFTVNKKIGEYEAKSDYQYKEYQFPVDTSGNSGIKNIGDNRLEWEIYPNPTKDHLFSVVLPDNFKEDYSIQIFDMKGALVYDKICSKLDFKRKTDIDLKSVNAGNYIIKLQTKTSQLEKNIQIQ